MYAEDHVYAYELSQGRDRLLVALNSSAHAKQVRFPVEAPAGFKAVFGQAGPNPETDALGLKLEPRSGVVLTSAG